MKIQLKTNKKIFNNFFMHKEKGENIIIGGGDGSGRTEILLQFFLYMVKNNIIDKNSVFIDFVNNNSIPIKIQTILSNYALDFNHKDFIIFSPTFKNNVNIFNNIKFNDGFQKKLLNKHKFFLMPCLEKSIYEYKKNSISQFFNYLKSLPNNEGKEIPIFVDHLSDFKYQDFKEYSEIMKTVNNKGYFFINSTYGMFNIFDFEKSFQVLKDSHKHFLMAHSQINLDNNFIKHINFKEALNNIESCDFYYLKDFELQSNHTLHLKDFFNSELYGDKLIYTSGEELYLSNKIQEF
tara:strand:+ start:23249 stop:24127 length:879 start_codon:yes stop_codon:yes gene_type:complete